MGVAVLIPVPCHGGPLGEHTERLPVDSATSSEGLVLQGA